MTVDCGRYAQHDGKGKCLGIFKSIEAAAAAGPLDELCSCLYDSGRTYAGRDPAECYAGKVMDDAGVGLASRTASAPALA